uniref:Protein SMG9 n=1 Tax=Hyaloperonospora arabidopsidis (strain Emoy2) TaxID=559515 RepID=M4BHP1_HYAAE
MSKTPSMLVRGGAGGEGPPPPPFGTSSSPKILYEPDVHRLRTRSSVARPLERDNRIKVENSNPRETSPSATLDRRSSSRIGSLSTPRRLYKPTTVQQTKICPPSSCVKLITPQMQFATDLSTQLGTCLELTNFTVVGVLGFDGVGKSTVLSLLARNEKTRKNQFKTRSSESVVSHCHETTGVDLAVSMVGGSGHPTILLDTQPLLSSSMLVDLLERKESHRFGAMTPEQQVEAASYQIAVFLCAICHYVLVVHDGLAFQVSVHELLYKVKQKFSQCRLPSVSGNSQKHAAQILFVANNVADSELLYRASELLSAHERALEAAWSQSLVRVPYKVTVHNDPAVDDSGSLNVASFVLPHRQQRCMHQESSGTSLASGHKEEVEDQIKSGTCGCISNKYADFDDAADDFQRFVLSLPSSPSFTPGLISAMTPGSKPLPPLRPLSLREWLNNASRVFEGVRKASCFTAEYNASRDHQ